MLFRDRAKNLIRWVLMTYETEVWTCIIVGHFFSSCVIHGVSKEAEEGSDPEQDGKKAKHVLQKLDPFRDGFGRCKKIWTLMSENFRHFFIRQPLNFVSLKLCVQLTVCENKSFIPVDQTHSADIDLQSGLYVRPKWILSFGNTNQRENDLQGHHITIVTSFLRSSRSWFAIHMKGPAGTPHNFLCFFLWWCLPVGIDSFLSISVGSPICITGLSIFCNDDKI